MVRLIMLGGTGSGKSTQAQRLSEHLQIPIISTGDLVREEITKENEFGNQIKPYFEQGELIPDPILIEVIKERLILPDLSHGWLLEGYPRTAFQAEELDFLLEKLNQNLNWAVYLKVSDQTMLERSLKRNLHEDTMEVIETRIKRFYQFTVPILEYYEKKHHLLTINGEQSLAEVEAEILNHLKS